MTSRSTLAALAVGTAALALAVTAAVSAPKFPTGAVHHPNHSWPVSAKLKPGMRLVLLKRVRAHDRYVIATRAKHRRGTVALHRRQLTWTSKRIAKAKRQIRLAHTVPGYWYALHTCEEGNRPWHIIGPDAEFSGGLGIRKSSWSAFRLPSYPSSAYYATKWQQIQVARAIMRVGTNGWSSCSPVAAHIAAIEGL